MQVQPITSTFGCEVRGLDVAGPEAGSAFSTIKNLISEHQLLVIKDQSLTPDGLMRFTRLFGEPEKHILRHYTLADYPEIFVISNAEDDGKPAGIKTVGYNWHTDHGYLPEPTNFIIIYALEAPAEGGATLFANTQRIFEEMTEAERAFLRGREAIYSYLKLYDAKPHYGPPMTPEERAKYPDVQHPLVNLHPETGKERLYINRGDCKGITGLGDADGLALVHDIFERIINSPYTYAHQYEPGDLVVWDNHSLLHAASPFDMDKYTRRVHRTCVAGQRLIPAPMSEQLSAAM